MKAVVFPEPRSIRVEDVPEPDCKPDEVIVEVARAGLCGTDVHIYKNEYLSAFPLIAGHEFSGKVVAVGRDVTFLSEGDRVACDPNIDCGHCAFCRRQQNNQCRNWQGVGITRAGAFAERVAVPARVAYQLPDTISDAQAAWIEPLSCVVHALNRLTFEPGDDVLLFGTGPIGTLLMQMLRHRGASRVVVVDRQAHRLDLARRLGATHAILASDQSSEELKSLAPDGFPIVVDATGVPNVIAAALDYLRPYGRFLQFGVAPRGATVPLEPFKVFKNDWTILGSFALCYTFEPAIALLAAGSVDVLSLVSHTLPLDRFEEGFNAFAAGESLKVQFVPGQAGIQTL
jgi:2-desacetyl-2-hydroxyethyl bacteriochlorophyllide A dehydrogenase